MRKILLSLLFSLSGIALAQTPAPDPDSPEELARQHALAQTLRKQARQGREEAESIREKEYNACLAKILVNACRQEAREHYIERMKSVRAMEQEANTIDRIAKSKEAALQDARIAENASAPASAPAVRSEGRTPPKPAPVTSTIRRHESDTAPAPSATGAAKANEERATRESEAATAKSARDKEAKEHADQARKDAARYDANAKAIAEKKAKRAAREAAKSPAASAPASTPR